MAKDIEGAGPEHPEGTSVADAAVAIEKIWDKSDDQDDAADKAKADADEGSDAEQTDDDSDTDDKDDIDASNDDQDDKEEEDDGDDEQDEGDTGEEGSSDEDDSDDSAEPITSLKDLAEATETPIEEILANIKHTVGDTEVPLGDMVASYKDKATRDQLTEAIRAQGREREEAYTKQSALLAQSMGAIEKLMVADIESADMQALRTTDPGEWNARVTEAGQKIAKIKEFREYLSSEYDKHMEAERNKFFENEGKKLKAEVPDWGADKLQLALGVMANLGFNQQEVSSIADSRLIKAALKFSELEAENKALKEAATKSKAVAKEVKKTVPKKTLSPNTRKGDAASKGKGIDRKNVISLKRRLAKSHKVEDAAKVIEAMMT